MKILPPETHPPQVRRERRHAPAAGDYASYRPCLRWDFGFTCPFCLVHEADLAHCVDGTGLTSIEHFVPKSTGAGARLRNAYEACLYVCRFCNGARGRTPNVSSTGATLLDPTQVAWAEHFTLVHARLDAREGDEDAQYTSETYDLNEPRRIALLQRLHAFVAGSRSPEDAAEAIWQAVFLEDRIRNAWLDLERFRLVPADAPSACRCETAQHRRLPPDIEQMGVELMPPG